MKGEDERAAGTTTFCMGKNASGVVRAPIASDQVVVDSGRRQGIVGVRLRCTSSA